VVLPGAAFASEQDDRPAIWAFEWFLVETFFRKRRNFNAELFIISNGRRVGSLRMSRVRNDFYVVEIAGSVGEEHGRRGGRSGVCCSWGNTSSNKFYRFRYVFLLFLIFLLPIIIRPGFDTVAVLVLVLLRLLALELLMMYFPVLELFPTLCIC